MKLIFGSVRLINVGNTVYSTSSIRTVNHGDYIGFSMSRNHFKIMSGKLYFYSSKDRFFFRQYVL